jgi:surface-anchored protein
MTVTTIMNSKLTIALLAAAALSARAQTYITEDHVDIGIGYKAGGFDLHIHQEDPVDTEYAPDEAIFLIGDAARVLSPGGAFSGFLGASGSTAWVLPDAEVAGLPYIGFGTEELTATDWLSNISLSVTGVNGPGEFSIWSVGSFGAPTLLVNSTDGLNSSDMLSLIPGSHGHFNLGFTAPGVYEVDFVASGTHAADGVVTSAPATYRFEVVPEPSTWALMILGGIGLLALGRNRIR